VRRVLLAVAIALALCAPARAGGPERLTANGAPFYLDGSSLCFNTSSAGGLCATVSGVYTFSGVVTFSAAGTALIVTNSASIGANLSFGNAAPQILTTSTTNGIAILSSNASTTGFDVQLGGATDLPTPAAAPTSQAVLDVPIPEPANTSTPAVAVMYIHPSAASGAVGGPYGFIGLSAASRDLWNFYALGTSTSSRNNFNWWNASGTSIWRCTNNSACTIGGSSASETISGTSNNSGYVATGNAAFPAPAATTSTAWFGGMVDGGTAGLVNSTNCTSASATPAPGAGCAFMLVITPGAGTGTWTITLPGGITRNGAPGCWVNDEAQPPTAFINCKPSTTTLTVKAWTFAATPAATTVPNTERIDVHWIDNGG